MRASVLIALGGVAAWGGASLAMAAEQAAPAKSAEVSPFSGLYLGTYGSLRAVSNAAEYSYTGTDYHGDYYTPATYAMNGEADYSNSLDGFGLGFDVGLNAVSPEGLVLGAELRGSMSTLRDDLADWDINTSFGCDACTYTSTTSTTRFNETAEMRVKLGYAFDQSMAYLSVGRGYAHVTSVDTVNAEHLLEDWSIKIADDAVLSAWTLGAGYETMVSPDTALSFGVSYADYGQIEAHPAVTPAGDADTAEGTLSRRVTDASVTLGWNHYFR